MRGLHRTFTLMLICGGLSACSTTSEKAPTPPAPGVKLGKPYEVFGKTYTPKYEPMYDEIGTASWYGPGFHGKYTANGEVFNQDDLTAAHATLPLPSMVRVTNLENGKSAVVRVNDRGPFKDGRIIDLSRGSARQLGITSLCKVRVQFLKEESEQYWATLNLKQPPEVLLAQARAPLTAKGGNNAIETTDITEGKSTAPIMSVASADLPAKSFDQKQLKIHPIQPSFKVISDAEAAEPPPPAPAASAQVMASTSPASSGSVTVTGQVTPPSSTPADSVVTITDTPPPAPPKPAPVPANVLSKKNPSSGDSAAGEWYVQAGAFASPLNAETLAGKLKSIGEPHIDDMNGRTHTLHRVRMGPFASKAEAERQRQQVASLGIHEAQIVKE